MIMKNILAHAMNSNKILQKFTDKWLLKQAAQKENFGTLMKQIW